MKIIIHTDGGARGNPGPAASGVVIEAFEGNQKLWEKKYKKYLGTGTNNMAEYQAMIMALTELKNLAKPEDEVEVRTDSELIHRQILGQYRVKEPNLKELFSKVAELKDCFKKIKFIHVRRESNAVADALVNEALDENALKPSGIDKTVR